MLGFKFNHVSKMGLWWRQQMIQIWVNFSLSNGLLPGGTKLLPEAMLNSD